MANKKFMSVWWTGVQAVGCLIRFLFDNEGAKRWKRRRRKRRRRGRNKGKGKREEGRGNYGIESGSKMSRIDDNGCDLLTRITKEGVGS